MIRSAFALLLVAAIAVAGDAPPPMPTTPHQASLVTAEKTFPVVFVFSETTEGAVYALESADAPQTQLARNRYQKLVYADPREVAWLRGRNLMADRKFADAAAQYLIATTSRDTWYTRHSAFLNAAECQLEAGQPAETIKTLDAMLAMFPKSAEQARIAFLRGRALTKQGDAAGALKVYAELVKHTADWGADAAALGALGQAELLATDKKNAEAAAVLLPVFAKSDPVKDPRFAQVGGELARQQTLAGQAAPAIATLRRLAYGSPVADDRAQAQLAWAKQLAAAGDAASLFSAFDHAAMALGIRQAEGATLGQAQSLAGQIAARIDKLPADQCSNDLKAEYRRYLQR